MKRTIALLAASIAAFAGETKTITLDKREDFSRGLKISSLVITARGELRLGRETAHVALADESAMWTGCWSPSRKRVFAASASGKIYRVGADGESARGAAELAFDTKEMLVTSVIDRDGEIFAATIPNGKIFKMSREGNWSEWARVPSKYVWQIAAARDRDGLYAACGSPARVYHVSATVAITEIFEARAENVLSLAHSSGGALVVGTSKPGMLLRLGTSGGTVIHDFQDYEVRSVHWSKDAVIAAVNKTSVGSTYELIRLGNAVNRRIEPRRGAMTAFKQQGDEILPSFTPPVQSQPPMMNPSPTPRPSTPPQSAVWRVSAARNEAILEFDGTFITGMAVAEDGVYVGTNAGGRVFRIAEDRSYDISFDFNENQVAGLVSGDGRLRAVLLGDRGGVALVTGSLAASGTYVSQVYDAQFLSHWGNLSTEKKGAVEIQTRTGLVANPDDGWTDWSEPVAEFPAKIKSPKGRYIQFKLTIKDAKASVDSLTLAFRSENQRPQISAVAIASVPPPIPPVMYQPGQPPPPQPKMPPHATLKTISWQAVDPNGDALVYSVFIRAAGTDAWTPITREPQAQNMIQWNTELVPDGRYRVKIVASDERSNGPGEALTAEFETDEFAVDNTKPEIKFSKPTDDKISGVASDKMSPIVYMEYSIDGKEWLPLLPADGLFDSPSEDFELKLDALTKGAHTITIKAYDRESNSAVSNVYVTK